MAWEIVCFRRCWTEFFCLLGRYAAWGGFKPTFRDYIYYILRTTYSRVKLSYLKSVTIEVETDRYSRNVGLVPNRLTPCNDLEDGRMYGTAYCIMTPYNNIYRENEIILVIILKRKHFVWSVLSLLYFARKLKENIFVLIILTWKPSSFTATPCSPNSKSSICNNNFVTFSEQIATKDVRR
jgi:hypothetical protein